MNNEVLLFLAIVGVFMLLVALFRRNKPIEVNSFDDLKLALRTEERRWVRIEAGYNLNYEGKVVQFTCRFTSKKFMDHPIVYRQVFLRETEDSDEESVYVLRRILVYAINLVESGFLVDFVDKNNRHGGIAFLKALAYEDDNPPEGSLG